MGIFSAVKQHPFRNLIYTPLSLQMHASIICLCLLQKRSQVGHFFTCEPCKFFHKFFNFLQIIYTVR